MIPRTRHKRYGWSAFKWLKNRLLIWVWGLSLTLMWRESGSSVHITLVGMDYLTMTTEILCRKLMLMETSAICIRVSDWSRNVSDSFTCIFSYIHKVCAREICQRVFVATYRRSSIVSSMLIVNLALWNWVVNISNTLPQHQIIGMRDFCTVFYKRQRLIWLNIL